MRTQVRTYVTRACVRTCVNSVHTIQCIQYAQYARAYECVYARAYAPGIFLLSPFSQSNQKVYSFFIIGSDDLTASR